MTDLTAKFSPNPYNNLDPDFGEESSLFNTLKIFAPAVQQETQTGFQEIGIFLDLGATVIPFISTKKEVSIFDTSKSDESFVAAPSQLSPTFSDSSLLPASQQMVEEVSEGQMKDQSHNRPFLFFSGVNELSSENTSTKSNSKKNRSQGAKRVKVIVPVIPNQRRSKKDQKKNMYGNSVKLIIKQLLSPKYKRFFKKLCRKYRVKDVEQLKSFYSEKINQYISLQDLRSYLNYEEHSQEDSMRAVKQAFLGFYVWFMRKKYTIHILTEDKIIHKEIYIQAKNFLVYLPELKDKEKFKAKQTHQTDE